MTETTHKYRKDRKNSQSAEGSSQNGRELQNFLKSTLYSIFGLVSPENNSSLDTNNSFESAEPITGNESFGQNEANNRYLKGNELINLKIQEYGFNCKLQYMISKILKRLGSVMLQCANKERCFPLLCNEAPKSLLALNKSIIGKNGSYYIPTSQANNDRVRQYLPLYFNRKTAHKLSLDIFPGGNQDKLIRNFIDNSIWQKIRSNCFRSYGYRCTFCGIDHNSEELACNENWYFHDDCSKYGVAFFGGFSALCQTCYNVKNFLNEEFRANFIELVAWLIIANKFSVEESREFIENCYNTKEHRDSLQWEFDYTVLHKNYGPWLV